MSIQSTSGIHNQALQAESNPGDGGKQSEPAHTASENIHNTTQAAITVANEGEQTNRSVITRIGNALKVVAQSVKQIALGIHTNLENLAHNHPKTALLLGVAGLLMSVMTAPVLLAPLPGLPVFAAIAGSTAVLLGNAISTLVNKSRQNPQPAQN